MSSYSRDAQTAQTGAQTTRRPSMGGGGQTDSLIERESDQHQHVHQNPTSIRCTKRLTNHRREQHRPLLHELTPAELTARLNGPIRVGPFKVDTWERDNLGEPLRQLRLFGNGEAAR